MKIFLLIFYSRTVTVLFFNPLCLFMFSYFLTELKVNISGRLVNEYFKGKCKQMQFFKHPRYNLLLSVLLVC